MDAEQISVSKAEKIIEAVLFAAGYPVTYQKLAEILNYKENEVRKIAASMEASYPGRGIQMVLYDDSCQLCTVEDCESYIKTALGIRRNGNLSKTSLEVLAIVAYNQPVTRAYIEQVRGVDSAYAVNSLIERGLIEAKGRLDVPGRPNLYGTTADFLRCFGLSSIGELPMPEVLLAPDEAESSLLSAEAAEDATEEAAENA